MRIKEKRRRRRPSYQTRHLRKLRAIKRAASKALPTYHSKDLEKDVGRRELLRPFKVVFEPGQMEFFENSQSGLKNTLRTIVGKADKVLPVNVSESSKFSGNYSRQSVLDIPAEDFFDYEGSLHLYLAQHALYRRFTKSNTIFVGGEEKHCKASWNSILESINKAQRKYLADSGFRIPCVVRKLLPSFKEIDFINLWYSKKKTNSEWHYDSYDNLLCVLKGSKRFSIIAPNKYCKVLKYEDVSGKFYNQGKLQAPRSFLKKRLKATVIRNVLLRSYEALYLPKGWHHRVSSFGDEIIALNFWFRCVEREVLLAPINRGFYLRYSLHCELEKTIKRHLEYVYRALRAGKSPSLCHNQSHMQSPEFFCTLFKTPPQQIRLFIEDLMKDGSFSCFINGLSLEGVELLLQKLEEIDTRLQISANTNYLEIHKLISVQILETDFFYENSIKEVLTQGIKDHLFESRKIYRKFMLKFLKV